MTGNWDREDRRQRGFVFMAVGALLAGLCGACTWNAMRNGGEFSGYALFGFAPVALGLFLFVKGLVAITGDD